MLNIRKNVLIALVAAGASTAVVASAQPLPTPEPAPPAAPATQAEADELDAPASAAELDAPTPSATPAEVDAPATPTPPTEVDAPATVIVPEDAMPIKVKVDAPAVPLEVNASFFSRYELRSNYNEFGKVGRRFGESDGTVYRARLGLVLPPVKLDSGLAVSVLFQPQASGYWGDVSGGLIDAGLGVHQAKTRLAKHGHWLDLGRFEMIYGEHLMIGNVGWHQTARAFDGARAHARLGDTGAYVDGFATILREGSLFSESNPTFAGDFIFTGIYAGVGPAIAKGLDLDLYALFNISPRTLDGSMVQDFTTTEVTLGARVKKSVGSITLRGEGGFQFGERAGSENEVLAFQVDADAMAKVTSKVALGAGGQYASGDDPDTTDLEGWNQLYPTAHKFLGLMDIIGGRSNIASAIVKARATATPSVKIGFDGHAFWRPETAMDVDSYTGLEGDGWVAYLFGKGLTLRGQYSAFFANEDGPLGDGGPAHYVEVQLSYTR